MDSVPATLVLDDVQWERCRAGLLRPARSSLTECVVALCGCETETARSWIERDTVGRNLRAIERGRLPQGVIDPVRSARRAWEVLAPEAWLSDSHRGFARSTPVIYQGRYPDYVTEVNERRITHAHPYTIGDVLSLCSDTDGVSTAEALARELAVRTGMGAQSRVIWRTLDADAIVRDARPVEFDIDQPVWKPNAVAFAVRSLVDCIARNHRGVALMIVDGFSSVRPDNVADPFRAGLALIALGYALGDMCPQGVELLMPAWSKSAGNAGRNRRTERSAGI